MKAITLWQPWASLVEFGFKKFETRSWPTSYRGPLAIHAATKTIKQVYKELFPMSAWDYHPDSKAKIQLCEAIEPCLDTGILEYGGVVAKTELVECYLVGQDAGGIFIAKKSGTTGDYVKFRYIQDKNELMFGNWTPGRFAWELKNVERLENPVPAKGRQGLWNWDEEAA